MKVNERGWKIWATGGQFGTSWHAAPPNGPASVVHADTEAELQDEIEAWENRTPEEIESHLASLREDRDKAGSDFTRSYLDQRIAAEGPTTVREV